MKRGAATEGRPYSPVKGPYVNLLHEWNRSLEYECGILAQTSCDLEDFSRDPAAI
jgi:hypothetical protein